MTQQLCLPIIFAMIRLSLAKEREIVAISARHGRRRSGKIIAEGVRAVSTLLQERIPLEYLVISTGHLTGDGERFLRDAELGNLPVYECEEKRFAKLADTVHSQGVLAVLERRFREITAEVVKGARFGLYLDGVSDPGNLGTVIRTAAAFGVDFLAVSRESADLGNPKTIRASAGLIFRLPVERVADPETFFRQLKSNHMMLLGSDVSARDDMETITLGKRICLAIGSEASGLTEFTKSNCQSLFRIRTAASVESLNAAAAAAIAIHHIAARLEVI